jgi:hypothetical protein
MDIEQELLKVDQKKHFPELNLSEDISSMRYNVSKEIVAELLTKNNYNLVQRHLYEKLKTQKNLLIFFQLVIVLNFF